MYEIQSFISGIFIYIPARGIYLPGFELFVLKLIIYPLNPLTPELNPSAQRYLPRFLSVDFNF
jgi:hypothetical protein